MADAKPPEPPESEAPPLSTSGELASAWQTFRAGGIAQCPVDGAPLALSVDGTANVYRFVCTKCGVASSWFEAGAAGLLVRGPRTPVPSPPD